MPETTTSSPQQERKRLRDRERIAALRQSMTSTERAELRQPYDRRYRETHPGRTR